MSPAASTRWCPTPEQVMILEEMYRGGVRTPNATQIQQITAHLSLYGKIEGKNVFYWFQNHKARDRQKLRKKLLGKQLQQQMLFSPFSPPCFDPSLYQHFQHVPHNNNNILHHHHQHHLQSVPAPPLPPPCCGATPPSLGLFHQVPTLNSPCFSAHQGRAEDIVPQMTTNSYTWKLEASSNAKYGRENSRSGIMSMITNDHDDWRMMMRSRDHHHDDDHNNHDDHDDDSTRRSLKTLELFPIKDKTSLKNDLTFVV